jgi:hypothetical protein
LAPVLVEWPVMKLPAWIVLLSVAGAGLGAEELATLRGKAHQERDKAPLFLSENGTRYSVSGDSDLLAQLGDTRLAGRRLEVQGRLQGSNHLEVVRLFTLKDGKRYRISYWCEICGSHLPRPGPCPHGHDVPGEPELRERPE